MVLQYWSRQEKLGVTAAADPRLIQQKLYSPKAKGIFASAMEEYFEQAGFRVFAFRGEWADLKNHLAKGRPLIVCLRGRSEEGWRHYVVVVGLDWERNQVFVNDPARRARVLLDWPVFERGWRAAGNWTLLALPKQQE